MIDSTLRAVLEDRVFVCIRFGAAETEEGIEAVLAACRAVLDGGLRLLEITLTTPGALDIMSALAGDSRAIVGAGTVLAPDDVSAVARAGARFVLSPVFDPAVVDAAKAEGLLSVPGAATPGEILAAHRHGAALVKVFPAGALGGPDYLRAVRGPLPRVRLVPTSGPSAETIAEYMAAGAVAVGVGREIFPRGFTLDHVRLASRRVREAMDAAPNAA